MSGLAVVVEFCLKTGRRGAFRTLVDANARASVRTEDGCRRFDVLEPDGEPDMVLLYEIYADRTAFDRHLASDHYRAFAAASEPLCSRKTVTVCDLVCEGGEKRHG